MKKRLLAALFFPLAAFGAPDLVQYRDIPLWDVGQVPAARGNGPLDAPFLTVFTTRAGTANGGMPPGGGLSDEQRQLVTDWLTCGDPPGR